ncbi:hypothetical protein PHMEG_00033950 [Phytophthora megakarya]|uniref:Integrase catalytic domain-containing protein n=1 Tax=Phytophthora megakarya TaxID=4795 RepID=A0A225URY3_9STRA|nr:hypothetical protein PHMEG_00033950 [Phytophthora megakarya]
MVYRYCELATRGRISKLQLRKKFAAGLSHDRSLPPWINGSIERANRDIIQVLRAFCLEYEVDTHDWTFFVPILQGNLNHTPVPSLGNKAPIELFCGLPLPSPLDVCMDAEQKKIIALPEQPE